MLPDQTHRHNAQLQILMKGRLESSAIPIPETRHEIRNDRMFIISLLSKCDVLASSTIQVYTSNFRNVNRLIH